MKASRPQKISEAQKLIEITFEEQEWDEKEQQDYFAMIGVAGAKNADDVRLIIKDMEDSRMILFKDE